MGQRRRQNSDNKTERRAQEAGEGVREREWEGDKEKKIEREGVMNIREHEMM